VINKIDLAPLISADLAVMDRDAKAIRKGKPHVFVNCKDDTGIQKICDYIVQDLLFEEPPKARSK
jgi:urease accessory protein